MRFLTSALLNIVFGFLFPPLTIIKGLTSLLAAERLIASGNALCDPLTGIISPC